MLTHAARAKGSGMSNLSGLFSCFAAVRAACVSTWLGEVKRCKALLPRSAEAAALRGARGRGDTRLGRFLFTKPLGLNPNLIELNELKTRVSFFLKLDNGKYCP